MISRNRKTLLTFLILVLIISIPMHVFATNDGLVKGVDISIGAGGDTDLVDYLKLLFLFTILTFAPAILLMMTSFTRIIIVLSFVRRAIATQTTPPNQVLIGIALFLTFFIMSPVINEVNVNAVQPYLENEITQEEFLDKSMKPIKSFMYDQTRAKDLELFMNLSNAKVEITDENNNLLNKENILNQIPSTTLIPAFIISELKTAFIYGFILFIPFLVVDMVVASTLMSMGMMMLPPVMISMPFKILLFIMVDGWNLVIKALVTGFK